MGSHLTIYAGARSGLGLTICKSLVAMQESHAEEVDRLYRKCRWELSFTLTMDLLDERKETDTQ